MQLPANYRVSVKVVIKKYKNPEKILLIREKDGEWELPGGGLEHGEDPKNAVTREVFEELGIKVTHVSEQPIGFWTIYKRVSPNLSYFAFVLYEAEVADTNFVQSKEASEASFFSKTELLRLDLLPGSKPIIEMI